MRRCGYPSAGEDSLQIAVLGDSHAFGLGVGDDQTYAALLNANGYPTRLVACSSFGTAREFIKCEELVRQGVIRKPTVLVLHYCENDSLENNSFVNNDFRYDPPAREEFDQMLGQPSHPVRYGLIYYLLPDILRPLSWPTAVEYRLLKSFSFEIPVERKNPVQVGTPQPVRSFDEDLGQIVLHYLQKPAFGDVEQVILLDAMSPGYFPTAGIEYEARRMEALRNRLDRALPDVSVSFLTPGSKDTERYFFRYDDHINAAGHAFFFSEIQESIDRKAR